MTSARPRRSGRLELGRAGWSMDDVTRIADLMICRSVILAAAAAGCHIAAVKVTVTVEPWRPPHWQAHLELLASSIHDSSSCSGRGPPSRCQ